MRRSIRLDPWIADELGPALHLTSNVRCELLRTQIPWFYAKRLQSGTHVRIGEDLRRNCVSGGSPRRG